MGILNWIFTKPPQIDQGYLQQVNRMDSLVRQIMKRYGVTRQEAESMYDSAMRYNIQYQDELFQVIEKELGYIPRRR